MKYLYITLFIFIYGNILNAQVSSYSFSETTGNTFSSISSSGIVITLGDDDYSSINIPFSFIYNNVTYTSINVGSNGYLRFGSGSASNYSNDLASTSDIDVIAPYWDDLDPSSGGNVYYQTQGSSPNRMFIVEYNNVPAYGNTSVTLLVQVVLHETSNNIEYRYGSSVGPFNSGSIGLNNSPGGSNNFLSVTPGSPATISYTTVNNNVSNPPSSGVNYLFAYSSSNCNSPYNQLESSTTSNSIELSWSQSGSVSSWQIEYGLSGFTQGGGAVVTVSSSPYTLTGLSANTTYDWYIRADCGSNGYSNWTGPHTFTTYPVPTSLPLLEDFESGFNYFTNNTGNNVDFAIETSIIHGGSTSVKCSYTDNDTNILIETGIVDLSSTSIVYLSFWHIAFTEANFDKCYVEVSTDGGSSFSVLSSSTYLGNDTSYNSSEYFDENSYSIWNPDSTVSNSWWKKEIFDVSSFNTTTVKFRFKLQSDGSVSRDGWYIDDIKIYEPSCPMPTGQTHSNVTVNSVDLNWTENGTATAWEVEYGQQGYTQGTGTTVSTTQKPMTLNNLTSGVTYDWYVRSQCGGISYSDWRGPDSFTTSDGRATNPNPANGATGISVSSLTLDWDDVSGCTGYHISVGTTSGGTDVVNNDYISGSTNSNYTVSSNWASNTTYYWTVTTNFSSGNSVGDEWVFTTECGNITSFPYLENFTSWPPTCWEINHSSLAADFDWNSYSDASLYCAEANFWNETSGRTGIMISPSFDVSGFSNNVELDFDWSHKYDANYPDDSLSVDISDDGGASWQQVWAESGSGLESGDGAGNSVPGSFINSGIIDLSSFGDTIMVRFYSRSGYGPSLFIDSFRIKEHINCIEPSSLSSGNCTSSSADLDWTNGCSVNTWDIEYGLSGFSHGNGTIVSVSSKPFTLTGLNCTTNYDWYIRSDCGGGNKSPWSTVASFTTSACSPAEAYGEISKCSPMYSRPGTTNEYFYDQYQFSLAAAGAFDIIADWRQNSGGNFNGYLYLYDGFFDPDSPSSNLIASDDDYDVGGGNQSGSKIESQALSAGVNYVLIATTNDSNDTGGEFKLTISGPANVSGEDTTDFYGIYESFTHTPPPTDGIIRYASYQCEDLNGYTHYYNDNNSSSDYSDDVILLSIKKNGQNIGSVDDGNFSVLVAGWPGVSHITNPPASYVSSWNGWYVFNRYWKVVPLSQPSSGVNVVFYYTSTDFTELQNALNNNGFTAPVSHEQMYCYKINSVSGSYDANPENGHSGVPLANSNGSDGCWIYSNESQPSVNDWMYSNYGSFHSMETVVNHFSGGGGGSGNISDDDDGSPLPISLLLFTGSAQPDFNIIKWSTASEINSGYFVVERSYNVNDSSVVVGKILASGNSNSIVNYQINDYCDFDAYYRLLAFDNDGKVQKSNWIFVRKNVNELKIGDVFPNPAGELISVNILNNSFANGTVFIYDIVGKLLITKKVNLNSGSQNIMVDINELNTGTYKFIIQIGKSRKTMMFVKR